MKGPGICMGGERGNPLSQVQPVSSVADNVTPITVVRHWYEVISEF